MLSEAAHGHGRGGVGTLAPPLYGGRAWPGKPYRPGRAPCDNLSTPWRRRTSWWGWPHGERYLMVRLTSWWTVPHGRVVPHGRMVS